MIKWPWIKDAKDPEARGRAITFLLCLLFSFIAWLSIKLSKETLAIIPLEVRITNIPETVIFSTPTDTTFTVSIETTGIRLLSNQSFRRGTRLETDFNMLQRSRGDDSSILFITANQAEARFSMLSDLPRNALSVHPDTIFFSTTEAFRKKVPVIIRKDIEFQPGFKTYGVPTVSPDSVHVTGPLWLIDSVNYIHTAVFTKSNVDNNIDETVPLVNHLVRDQLVLSENTVELFIPVEEFTEETVELPLRIDCPEISEDEQLHGRLLLFPDRINVSYLVALKDIKTISPEMFTAVVACPDTLAMTSTRLNVTVSNMPPRTEIIRIRPQEVEFLWIKD